MSKLIKLYHIILSNVSGIFLFVFLVINSDYLFSQNSIQNKINTIVIDAGHGGKDPGTLGTKRFKIYEKHVALAVSLKLGEYIAASYPDINIVYTRKKDVFLKLHERTEIANKSEADLFISIHCDGFLNQNASGASVFVMGMSKLKANLDVAMRENSAIYLEDNYQEKYEGFDPKSPESYIVFSLMQNTYLDQSINLAEHVEHEFSNKANRKSRGVKQAPFYVISRTNMPSVLIECGFLTNPKEEEFLHSKTGQDYIASAIFRAFRSYKEDLEKNIADDSESEEKNIVSDSSDSLVTLKNINHDTDSSKDLTFKVQIGTFLKSMLKNEKFINIDVEEIIDNKIYKYFVGNEIEKSKADSIRKKMINNGFEGSFVVPFYKGNKISMKEALNLQEKNK